MKIKRFVAPDMRTAFALVRQEQGPDAVILSNRMTDDGVEIVAASNYDETLVQRTLEAMRPAAPAEPAPPVPSFARGEGVRIHREGGGSRTFRFHRGGRRGRRLRIVRRRRRGHPAEVGGGGFGRRQRGRFIAGLLTARLPLGAARE